jgi:hypothetical protein
MATVTGKSIRRRRTAKAAAYLLLQKTSSATDGMLSLQLCGVNSLAVETLSQRLKVTREGKLVRQARISFGRPPAFGHER